MPLPTIQVTPGSGTTINTLPNSGQATSANSLPVVVASDQPAIAVSAASLPLPTGAATSTNQPALNADGGALAHVTNFPATQPVSGTVTANAGTGTFGTNVAQIGGSAISTAAAGVQKAGITGNSGAAFDCASTQNIPTAANMVIVGAEFNTTPTAITSGNSSPLQLDSAGNLLVNVKAGAVSVSNFPATQAVSGASGAFVDGAIATIGTLADAAWSGSGNSSVIAALKAVYNKVAGTLTATLSGALPAGPNTIGNVNINTMSVGLNYTTGAISPPISTTAYSAGQCIGGLQTINNFFRTSAQPGALVNGLSILWKGAETAPLTFYMFSKLPAATFTNQAAFPALGADGANLLAAPITITPSLMPGLTTNMGSVQLNISAVNNDSTLSTNLYVAIEVGAAVTPNGPNDLVFWLTGVRD
jgi:hypothetical protein